MRRFLINLFLFMLLPIVYFGINMTVNYLIYNNQKAPLENKNILIAGDSHPQKSLNPIYFESAQNISQPAEPYVLTYWKLKKIFKTATPDTLILGFAPHNISTYNDLKFTDKQWSGELFKNSYPIQEFHKIEKDIPIDFKYYYQILWKQTAFYPKVNHINYIGAYSNDTSSNINDWEFATQVHYHSNGKELGISHFNLKYLDAIINLCNANQITVILVSHPLYKAYLENIPPNIMNKYKELSAHFSEKYIVFNKTNDTYPDSLYLNSDHLNELGATRFTNELIEYLGKKQASYMN